MCNEKEISLSEISLEFDLAVGKKTMADILILISVLIIRS